MLFVVPSTGKRKAWKVLLSKPQHQAVLAKVGDEFPLSADAHQGCEKYVCHLYGHPECDEINNARYKVFCARSPTPPQLPPCADALTQHLKRANFQAYVWKQALVAQPVLPSPSEHGWSLDHSSVSITWGLLPPAPPELMKIIRCSCTTGCSSRRCSCVQSSISCTGACQCNNCANPHNAAAHILPVAPAEDSADEDEDKELAEPSCDE